MSKNGHQFISSRSFRANRNRTHIGILFDMRAINTKGDCYLYYAEEIRPLIAEMEAQNNEDYSELHNDIASLFDLLAMGEEGNLQNDRIKNILLKVQLASPK